MLWLISYNGHNHVIKRFQIELQGFSFTIVHRGNAMLEDANYLSHISQEVQLDPLLADYERTIRKLRMSTTIPSGEINKQNLPGRRTLYDNGKDQSIPDLFSEQDRNSSACHFASIDKDFSQAEAIEWEYSMEKEGLLCLCNTPVIFSTMQPHSSGPNSLQSKLHNNYVSDIASVLHSFSWCIANTSCLAPAQLFAQQPLSFRIAMVIEPLQVSRSILQENYKVANIYDNIDNALQALKNSNTKFVINAYFATVSVPSDNDATSSTASRHMYIKPHWIFINYLQQQSNLKVFVLH